MSIENLLLECEHELSMQEINGYGVGKIGHVESKGFHIQQHLTSKDKDATIM